MYATLSNMVFVNREPANARPACNIEQSGIPPYRKKWLAPFLVFLSCLCGLPASWGQGAGNIDSLIQELKRDHTPNQIVDTLNERAYEARREEELSEKLTHRALALAREIHYEKGEGDAYVRLGIIAKNRGEYPLAEKHYQKAWAIRKKLGVNGPIVGMYNNLGNLYIIMGQFSKALQYFQDGLGYVDETVEDNDELKLLNGMATCYQHLGEYPNALEYNDKDIELREKLGDRRGMANALLTSGNIYQKMRNLSLAGDKYQESLAIFESLEDSAGIALSHISFGSLYYEKSESRKGLEHYQKALGLKEFLSDDELARLYRNVGSCYMEMEKPDSALFYYNQSREMYQSDENAWGLADVEFSFGSFYAGRNQHQKALEHFTESLDILQKNQISDPSHEMALLGRISDAYTQLGDYAAALQYRNRHLFLQDSLNTLVMNAANYKYIYEEERRKNEEQQRENDNLANQTRIQRLKNMQLIYLFIGTIVVLASGAGIALLIYRQRQRKQAVDREIDDLLRNQENKTNYARIEGQDEERRRIAQDLHDGLGGMLSTVKLYFSALDTKMDLMRMESREQYSKANQLLDEACEEVRRVSHDMHSGILKNFGLKAQLEDLAETINNSKQVKVELITHKLSRRLDTQLEVNIYRIIQELIGNVLKHARASKLSIQLNRFDDIIHILVEDNGVGFKEGAALEKGGLGLSGLQARVKALDGTVNIDSALGRGTSISIDIPYQAREALTQNN